MAQVAVQHAGDLDQDEFADRLQRGLGIRIGPYAARLRVEEAAVIAPLRSLYRDYPLLADDNVFSFHARLASCRRLLPWQGRKVRFSVDGRAPHEDMPAEQALAVLEWGINLVIALRSHNFLMLHAAVVERAGRAMLLPAAPGSGKSTLCTALSFRGWRLFSDEFGLFRPHTVEAIPLPRPMALKNESIDVIRAFAPDADFGPTILNTRKGTVVHVAPPADSVRRAGTGARTGWLVFPRWRAGVACRVTEIGPQDSFMQLATNAFNYELLGEAGFDTVRRLVEASRSFLLEYSRLDDAVAALNELAQVGDD